MHELRGAARVSADLRSFARLATDILLFRVLGLIDIPGKNRERSIRLTGGLVVVYRLNRGDIQSLREVWIDESYRLPFAVKPPVLVDLGANIGLTSLWMARRYGAKHVLAVEPSAANARLARLNLAANRVQGEVVEAAVGPQDGFALFSAASDSNIGRLGSEGERVQMVSMPSLLRRLPAETHIDVLKMDIEGGEQALLTGDIEWLSRVRSIIAEFHPDCVDYPGLIATLERKGFRYLPPSMTQAMDCFTR